MAATCNIETFAIENNADLTADNIVYSKEIDSLGVSLNVIQKKKNSLAIYVLQELLVLYNALAVIAVWNT